MGDVWKWLFGFTFFFGSDIGFTGLFLCTSVYPSSVTFEGGVDVMKERKEPRVAWKLRDAAGTKQFRRGVALEEGLKKGARATRRG